MTEATIIYLSAIARLHSTLARQYGDLTMADNDAARFRCRNRISHTKGLLTHLEKLAIAD